MICETTLDVATTGVPDQEHGGAGIFLQGAKGVQIELLRADEMGEVEVVLEAGEGKYTAERLIRCRPRVAQLCATLLADGRVAWRDITRVTGCHHDTLQALAENFPEIIEAEKKRLGRKSQSFSRMCIERAMEVLPSLEFTKPGDLAQLLVAFGIATEKAQLLLGGPTARIENVQKEDWRELRKVYEELAEPVSVEAGVGQKDGGRAAGAAVGLGVKTGGGAGAES